MQNTNKTVVHVWKQNCRNYPNSFWGIGDLVRGSVGLYQFCKHYNFNLIVDTSLYPVSKYLEKLEHPYSDTVKQDKDLIDFVQNYEYHILQNFYQNNVDLLFFNTNAYLHVYDTELDTDLKNFIKNILKPTSELESYIEQTLKNLDLTNKKYNVLHYRLGDSEIVYGNQNNNYDKLYEHFLDQVKIINQESNKDNNIILLSDSEMFKKYIKNKLSETNEKSENSNDFKLNKIIKTLDFPICHLGTSENDITTKNTLTELFIISKSEKINTFSVYSHISGFAYICHKIFNVPINCGVNLEV